MKKININLASTRNLLLFDCAARLGSFSRAAEELRIGQSAVSHGIRNLEERLGSRLFVRRHRGVELTTAGEKLASKVNQGFELIREGLQQVDAGQNGEQVVTLSVSTSLAGYWLMPRIARFKQRFPNIDIRCITRDTDRDIEREDFDLCIPLGCGPWPGCRQYRWVDEELLAVCSPAYARQFDGMPPELILTSATLLHLEERYRQRFDWQQWFTYFELPLRQMDRGVVSNDYSIVIQAAEEGQGLALGWRHIIEPLLEQHRLVKAVDVSIKTDNPFLIIAPKNREPSGATMTLLSWLMDEIKQERDVSN